MLSGPDTIGKNYYLATIQHGTPGGYRVWGLFNDPNLHLFTKGHKLEKK